MPIMDVHRSEHAPKYEHGPRDQDLLDCRRYRHLARTTNRRGRAGANGRDCARGIWTQLRRRPSRSVWRSAYDYREIRSGWDHRAHTVASGAMDEISLAANPSGE